MFQTSWEGCRKLQVAKNLNEDVLICQNNKNADTEGVNANDETATKSSH